MCDALPVAIRFLCFNGKLERRQERQPPLPAAAGLLGVIQWYGTWRMQICPATGLRLQCLIPAPRWLRLKDPSRSASPCMFPFPHHPAQLVFLPQPLYWFGELWKGFKAQQQPPQPLGGVLQGWPVDAS